jgi:hypothetical protein
MNPGSFPAVVFPAVVKNLQVMSPGHFRPAISTRLGHAFKPDLLRLLQGSRDPALTGQNRAELPV